MFEHDLRLQGPQKSILNFLLEKFHKKLKTSQMPQDIETIPSQLAPFNCLGGLLRFRVKLKD